MRDTGMQGVTLRPEAEADRPFVAELYASTRASEMALLSHWSAEQKAEFVNGQFEAQRHHYRSAFPDARFDVIERDGAPIGRLYVARVDGTLRLMDITLSPEHRGQGVGGALVMALQEQAAAEGLEMGLHVEPANPAYRLYERLGFRFEEEVAFYHELRWSGRSS